MPQLIYRLIPVAAAANGTNGVVVDAAADQFGNAVVSVVNSAAEVLVLPTALAGTDGVITQAGNVSTLTSATLNTTGVAIGGLFPVVDSTHSANSSTGGGWAITAKTATSLSWTNASGVATASGVGWTHPPYNIAQACADTFTAGSRAALATTTVQIYSASGVTVNAAQPSGSTVQFALPAQGYERDMFSQVNLQSMTACDIRVWV